MIKKILPIIFIALLILEFFSGYTIESESFSFIMYHVGGFGALGILSCIVGVIANKKGYGYLRPLLIALLASIVVGIISAFLIPTIESESNSVACGGTVSLGVGVIFIVLWVLVKNKAKA